MIRVQVRHNEPLEAALRRFKRQCNYAGIFRLAKKAKVYEKPSEVRRREGRERARNIQRQIRKAMQLKRGRKKPRKPYGARRQEEESSTSSASTTPKATPVANAGEAVKNALGAATDAGSKAQD